MHALQQECMYNCPQQCYHSPLKVPRPFPLECISSSFMYRHNWQTSALQRCPRSHIPETLTQRSLSHNSANLIRRVPTQSANYCDAMQCSYFCSSLANAKPSYRWYQAYINTKREPRQSQMRGQSLQRRLPVHARLRKHLQRRSLHTLAMLGADFTAFHSHQGVGFRSGG